jgi:hypothetical protein
VRPLSRSSSLSRYSMYLNLTHLKPCEERWEDMLPSERGRLCAKCSKQIVDFRAMSILQIAQVHAASTTAVCGRYTAEQLAGSSLASTRTAPAAAAVSIALGASLLGATPSDAQPSHRPAAEQSALPLTAPASADQEVSTSRSAAHDTLRIQGVVRNAEGGGAIHGAQVFMPGIHVGALTDERGRFVLKLPQEQASFPLRISVMLIGYARRDFHLREGETEVEVVLEPMAVEITAFYVTGRPTLWQRLQFWKRP